MKRTLLASALVTVAAAGIARAQQASPAAPVATVSAKPDESNVRQAPTPAGFVGTYKTIAADSAPGGSFRLGTVNQFSKSSGFLVSGDSNTLFAGDVILNVTPIEHLETFLRFSFRANDNTKSSPTLIQVLGDMTLGLKGYFSVVPALTFGGAFQLRFLNDTGSASFKGAATSALLHQLTTFDMSKLKSKVPLRMHLNLGYHFDNSDALMTTSISSNPSQAVYRYALRINQTNRFLLALGFDMPLPYVTPFIDWNLEVPTTLVGANANGGRAFPHTLSFGARVFPWNDLGLLVGFDIGLTSAGTLGIPAVPAWAFVFGLSYNIEPGRSKTIENIVVKNVPVVPPATTGVVIGKITDKTSSKAIEGAIISFPMRDTARLATVADGSYGSFEITAGKVRVRVRADGYKAEDWDVAIPAGGVATLNVGLTGEPVVQAAGGVRGRVVDEAGQALAGATVELKAPGVDTVSVKPEAGTAAFSTKAKAGKYTLALALDGFQGVERAIEFGSGEVVVLEVALKRVAIQAVGDASIEGNRVLVKEKIEFARNSPKFAGRTTAMLDSVAKLLKGNPKIKKVQIEAHTDNRTTKRKADALTKKQADAVLMYLVDAGVAPERLNAKGLGSAKPIVPNLTNRDREKNRRVELVIAE